MDEVAPPATRRRRLPYLPALDGLRALCLAAVLLYHGGFGWAGGGFLGVSTFFTLSGFLIASLLVVEVRDDQRIDLRRFWSARARRLVPAALLTLVLVVLFVRFGASSGHLVGLRQDLWASIAVVINWRLALVGQTYANTTDATPVQHLWSLAVEEQFYIVLPLAITGLAFLARRSGRNLRDTVAVAAGIAAVASTAALALTVGDDVSFAYYATHTRAAELLVGVVLACTVHRLVRRDPAPWIVPSVAGVGAAVVLICWVVADQASPGFYRGGLTIYALGSGAVIVGCIHPGPMRTALAWEPLRWLGRISYGAYLYHWPLFAWIREDTVGLDPVPLFVVRVAFTLLLAALSYRYVEMPIRRGTALTGVPAPAFGAVALVAVALTFAVPARSVDTGPSGVEVTEGERVAAAVGGPATTATTEPAGPQVERLLIVGDSVPQQLAPYVAAAVPDVDVRFIGEGGTGLLTDQGLILEQVGDAVAELDPDMVIVHYAGSYLRLEPTEEPYIGPDGEEVVDGSEEMFELWEAVGRELVAVAGSRGAEVLWALIPPVGPGTTFEFMGDRIDRLNDIYRGLGVELIDWHDLASGPDGEFSVDLEGPDGEEQRARDPDGLHFTAFGNRLLADTVVEQVIEWEGRTEPAG